MFSFACHSRFKEYGVTFTEKWNTDNNLSATIDVQDQVWLNSFKLSLVAFQHSVFLVILVGIATTSQKMDSRLCLKL